MGFGMTMLKDAGQQAATGVVGGIMDLAFGKMHDRRQLKQQERLQELQMRGQREMINFQKAADLQMWKDTSYGAQVEQMNKAGINPGLLYGMSGGGGQTVGGSASGPTGATATQAGGGELGMSLQLGMMGAQKRLLEAQAANLEADTLNKPKVGANTEQDTLLKKANTEIAKVEAEVKDRSKEEAILGLQAIGRKLFDEARESNVRANTTEALQMEYEESVRAQLLTAALQNKQIQAQTGLTDAQTAKVAEDIAQGWSKLGIDKQNANTNENRLKLDQYVNNVTNKTKLTVETVRGIIQALLIGLSK